LYEDDGVSNGYMKDDYAVTEFARSTSGMLMHSQKVAGKRNTLIAESSLDVRERMFTPSASAGFFSKNESPSGFPFDPKAYLYLSEDSAKTIEWELRQDQRVLATISTPGARKNLVPTFDSSAPRPADLHGSIELIAKPQAASGNQTYSMPISILDRTFDVARAATATSSSSESGYTASGAIDGTASGYPHGKQFEWASNHEKTGAWVKLEWPRPQTIDTIWIYDRPNSTDQILGGILTFDDGSTLDVGELPNDGVKPIELTFPAKTIRSLAFKVSNVTEATQNAGVSEIAVFRSAGR